MAASVRGTLRLSVQILWLCRLDGSRHDYLTLHDYLAVHDYLAIHDNLALGLGVFSVCDDVVDGVSLHGVGRSSSSLPILPRDGATKQVLLS